MKKIVGVKIGVMVAPFKNESLFIQVNTGKEYIKDINNNRFYNIKDYNIHNKTSIKL